MHEHMLDFMTTKKGSLLNTPDVGFPVTK